jgi:hypothetical protein
MTRQRVPHSRATTGRPCARSTRNPLLMRAMRAAQRAMMTWSAVDAATMTAVSRTSATGASCRTMHRAQHADDLCGHTRHCRMRARPGVASALLQQARALCLCCSAERRWPGTLRASTYLSLLAFSFRPIAARSAPVETRPDSRAAPEESDEAETLALDAVPPARSPVGERRDSRLSLRWEYVYPGPGGALLRALSGRSLTCLTGHEAFGTGVVAGKVLTDGCRDGKRTRDAPCAAACGRMAR